MTVLSFTESTILFLLQCECVRSRLAASKRRPALGTTDEKAADVRTEAPGVQLGLEGLERAAFVGSTRAA